MASTKLASERNEPAERTRSPTPRLDHRIKQSSPPSILCLSGTGLMPHSGILSSTNLHRSQKSSINNSLLFENYAYINEIPPMTQHTYILCCYIQQFYRLNFDRAAIVLIFQLRLGYVLCEISIHQKFRSLLIPQFIASNSGSKPSNKRSNLFSQEYHFA